MFFRGKVNRGILLRGVVLFPFLLVTWCVWEGVWQGNWNSESLKKTVSLDQKKSERVPVLIVPHHLLAREEISRAFQYVSGIVGGDVIRRVILLSPNHFNIGNDWVVGSDRSWKTSFGSLEADVRAIATLRDIALVDRSILDREHGVFNILPFIKEYFPQAKIVPLALRDGFPDERSDELGMQLLSIADSQTLLIASADFSHYLDENFSRLHDVQAIEALSRLRNYQVNSLDVDCSSCLRVAMKYAEAKQAPNFHLLSRTSSLEMTHSDAVGQETSHIVGYYSSSEANPRQFGNSEVMGNVVSMLFSGSVLPKHMTPFARRMFMGQDLNIFGGLREEKGTAVFDIRREGYLSDVRVLNTGISELEGTPGTGVTVELIKGKRVAFVLVPSAAEPKGKRFRSGDISRAKSESDVVVVLSEQSGLLKRRLQLSREYIDVGADIVIGLAGTEIEPLEIYHSKLIVPSLGGGGDPGIALEVAIDSHAKTFEFAFLPVASGTDGRVAVAVDGMRRGILKKLSEGVSNEEMQLSVLEGRLFIGSCLESY